MPDTKANNSQAPAWSNPEPKQNKCYWCGTIIDPAYEVCQDCAEENDAFDDDTYED